MNKNPKDVARGEQRVSLSESVTHSMTKSGMSSETFGSYVRLSARPLPWSSFFWRDWQDLISCAEYFALSSISPFMRCTHRALAASSDCQPSREAGIIGRKLFNGIGSFMWAKGRLTAWFPLVSAATLHHATIFSTLIRFGWLLRREDTFADDISLRLAILLENPEQVDDTALLADLLKKEGILL